jgi:hypothetical protein
MGGKTMKQRIETQITLLSGADARPAPIRICYTDSEVELTLRHEGAEYCGRGGDCFWTDAFADLQKKLPKGILLACCMTCRHGSFCPYGNRENQLFCAKNVSIASKEDVLQWMEKDPRSFWESEVSALHFCDGFAPQSDAFYTYNDYLIHLQR